MYLFIYFNILLFFFTLRSTEAARAEPGSSERSLYQDFITRIFACCDTMFHKNWKFSEYVCSNSICGS